MNIKYSQDSILLESGRDPFTAALLSVVPGLGQLYVGDRRKAILFLNVALVNALVVAVCLWARELAALLYDFAGRYHMRVNADTTDSLTHLEIGSPASLLILAMALVFAVLCARDAYDQAMRRRRQSIYKDCVWQLSESGSASYLGHLAVLLSMAIMALFFVVRPAKTLQSVHVFMLTEDVPVEKPRQKTVDLSNKLSARHGTQHVDLTPAKPVPKLLEPPSPAAPAMVRAPERAPSLPALPLASANFARRAQVDKPPLMALAAPANLGLPAPAVARIAQNGAAPSAPQPLAPGSEPGGAPGPRIASPASAGSADSVAPPAPVAVGSGAHRPTSGQTAGPAPVRTGSNNGSPGTAIAVAPNLGAAAQPHRAQAPCEGCGVRGDEGRYDSLPSEVAPVDFSAYMAELQRRIKRHWYPPKGPHSEEAVVTFSVSRDGSVSNVRVARPTGNRFADDAAVQAVQDAAPFSALPAGSPAVVDIEFTFSYRVFRQGAARRL